MLIKKIRDDMKAAVKERNSLAANTLRMIIAAVMNEEVKLGKALDDGGVMALIQRGIKTRKESLEQFTKGGRQELADKEAKEIEVLQRYLPKQLDEAGTRALVEKIIAEVGAQHKGDVGKVMRKVMSEHRGEVEGALVQKIVGEILK
jgi:uncharacterized protein YqeY